MSKILLLLLIQIIFCRYYPVYNEISKSKKGKPKLRDIESSQTYSDYVKNSDNVIAYFLSDYCPECDEIMEALTEASRYKIFNKNWVFLKVDCSRNSHVCHNLGVENYPTSEVYRQRQQLYVELPTELQPMLELLYKLSTDPLVSINSKEDFFKNYTYYSPIVEFEIPKDEEIKKETLEEIDFIDIDEEEINIDFMKCIRKIANEDFIKIFYFGIREAKDYKEKIVFDNDNYPVTYYWDGVCQNAINFLYDNRFPLITNLDKYFLKDFESDPRTLITIITFPKNKKINDFISSVYKKLAYENRKYVFAYVDYEEDKNIFDEYFKVELNISSDIQLVIHNFGEKSYYVHKELFNIDDQSDDHIINEIERLVLNITNLGFETGSKFQDFINFIGLNKSDATREIIVIIVLICILAGLAWLCGAPEDFMDDDEYEDEYEQVSTTGKEKRS